MACPKSNECLNLSACTTISWYSSAILFSYQFLGFSSNHFLSYYSWILYIIKMFSPVSHEAVVTTTAHDNDSSPNQTVAPSTTTTTSVPKQKYFYKWTRSSVGRLWPELFTICLSGKVAEAFVILKHKEDCFGWKLKSKSWVLFCSVLHTHNVFAFPFSLIYFPDHWHHNSVFRMATECYVNAGERITFLFN